MVAVHIQSGSLIPAPSHVSRLCAPRRSAAVIVRQHGRRGAGSPRFAPTLRRAGAALRAAPREMQEGTADAMPPVRTWCGRAGRRRDLSRAAGAAPSAPGQQQPTRRPQRDCRQRRGRRSGRKGPAEEGHVVDAGRIDRRPRQLRKPQRFVAQGIEIHHRKARLERRVAAEGAQCRAPVGRSGKRAAEPGRAGAKAEAGPIAAPQARAPAAASECRCTSFLRTG